VALSRLPQHRKGRLRLFGGGRVVSDDVRKAVAIIEESKRSHQTWIAWYDKYPDEESVHNDTCGGKEWHLQCIEGYDHVLKVLKSQPLKDSE
jgi:hypothetical protein